MSSITSTVNFEKDGVQHGFLNLPHSHDGSAWGAILIPISCIKNGSGPTALLTAGNHGDEYEGILALKSLATELSMEEVQGRVLIVPSMNHPAVLNGSRTSPLDGGNMNRLFPGKVDGTPTEKIADYFTRVLIPLCDVALDIHSGGKTLEIQPYAAAHRLPDKEQEEACIAAALAFGAEHTVVAVELDGSAMYDTAVEKQGKVFVTTELGGGGSTTPARMEVARRGIRNFLIHTGLCEGVQRSAVSPLFLEMTDASCYVQAVDSGVLELLVALGESVQRGQAVAHIHHTEKNGIPPIVYTAASDGVLIAKRHTALVNMGDTIAVIAEVREKLE